MSSKISLAIVGAALAFSSIGCAGHFVSQEDYDRAIVQTRELNEALLK